MTEQYRKGDIVRITLDGETAKCKILGVIPDSRNSLGLNFEFERLTPWVPAHPSTEEADR
jgi:hypothetical protein